MTSAFTTGFGVSISLILAIGAQNAFVLRQGLRQEHVLAIVLTCAISDAILISLGVSGFSQAVSYLPWLEPVMRYCGAAFLVWYGWKNMHSAIFSNHGLTAADNTKTSFKAVMLTCLAITWLNPHVYLDTLMLIGAISTRFPEGKIAFTSGAVLASFIFFFSLGFGAKLLRPIFAKPIAWHILEFIIAIVMWAIAIKLVWI